MNASLRSDFHRFLETGGYATPPGRTACALRSARILAEFRAAESAGLVRIVPQAHDENYFDVYGEPDSEKERLQIEASLERMGCWLVSAEVNEGSESEGDDWISADSIGMCVYEDPCDPFENCYVIDLMASALRRIPQPGNVDELCTHIG